jgi:non-ribosomal peptide synthetase component E (peptide arylation enzyme)
MRPFLVTPDIIDDYLDAGYWTRETMIDRYRAHATAYPDRIACRDGKTTYTWADLDTASDRLAANLIDLDLDRDATALIQIASSCREIVLRVALKKAGIIGIFATLQWRRRELAYVWDRIDPHLVVMSSDRMETELGDWLDDAVANSAGPRHRIDMAATPSDGSIGWRELLDRPAADNMLAQIADRQFRFDEISLVTASSGTSGIAKLCEWPEGAQVFMSRVLQERMAITGDDTTGIFAPMSGAAGLMMWMVSWTVPCATAFPDDYKPATMLDLVADTGVTVGTTVPVILARLAQEPPGARDLSSLRLMRVGTAAADMESARTFEDRTGCHVIIASGSMECTGFGHANVTEPKELRLDGSVGLPLLGCRLRIDDPQGNAVPAGISGELKVTAPFSSSGYWKDPETTANVWSDGWYATGDIGVLDTNGRLTLLGRIKDTINRSGHKILPAEVEHEIMGHPNVMECSVVAAPDREYGQVPWAFVQMRPGCGFDADALAGIIRNSGLASYKIPARFIEVTEFPRISDNKIDKKALLETALSVD